MLLAGAILVGARAIAVPPREHTAWVLLELPPDIDPGPDEQYDDLRILDDRGYEVAYAINPECHPARSIEARVSDVGFVPSAYTQALIDAGTSGAMYEDITLTTSRETFFTRVAVAISDDRITWREVRNDALIYRVANTGDPGTQTVSFTPARARWIRIRVLDARQAFPIDGATLDLTASPKPERDSSLAAKTKYAFSRVAGHSTITFDLGMQNVIARSIRFETSQPEFERDVMIQSSRDGQLWNDAGSGAIARFAQGRPALDVAFSSSDRYLRATIENGDDLPLTDLRATLYGPQRFLVFTAQPRRLYTIGHRPAGETPHYDLADLLAHDSPRHFLRAHVEPTTPPQKQARRSSRAIPASNLLTAAFAFAIVTLGAITLLTLRPRP
jgi:hypothetical protein